MYTFNSSVQFINIPAGGRAEETNGVGSEVGKALLCSCFVQRSCFYFSLLMTGLCLFFGLLPQCTALCVLPQFKQAEMFRGAAGQYRLMATRLEERIRMHRMAMLSDVWKNEAVQEEEMATFNKFFTDSYKIILTIQGEMKYFPPGKAVAMWKSKKELLPSAIDQPEVSREHTNRLMDEFM